MNMACTPPRVPHSPCPLSPTALPTAGREGVLKNKSKAVSLLSRKGGCEAGEEGTSIRHL
jgi:hypothetical protein